MAALEEHMKDCVDQLGKDYKEVHLWLDEYFKRIGARHRSIRHHLEGIKEAAEKFGVDGGKAAEIHVRKDWVGIFSDIPNKKEAEMWSLFGREGLKDGREYLSDFEMLLNGDPRGQPLHK